MSRLCLISLALVLVALSAQAQEGLGGDTRAELRSGFAACWNIGSLSPEAQQTAVVVALSLGRDGRVDPESVRMVTSSSHDPAVTAQAYAAARRAVLRCGRAGFDLPRAQYELWREMELTFDPRVPLS